MGKYEPLSQFLKSQSAETIEMTFSEIEKVVKLKLPMSKKHRAWWSNNPNNNVMTKAWLEAGYVTESVDTEHGKLVFRRKSSPKKNAAEIIKKSIFGCAKGYITLAPGFDPTAPMELDHDWDAKYGHPNSSI